MITKHTLQEWIQTALADSGGAAHHVDVARWIWSHHRAELEDAGDLFFTWQYDLRWAAQKLRHQGKLRGMATGTGRGDGYWRLSGAA